MYLVIFVRAGGCNKKAGLSAQVSQFSVPVTAKSVIVQLQVLTGLLN